MRTTVTLDDDVEIMLKEEMRKGGKSFKQVVNEFLRRGLRPSSPESRSSYRTPSVSLGRCKLSQIDDVAEALAVAEGEDYR
jgi:hypothetical protein